jgi:hypothetical protein
MTIIWSVKTYLTDLVSRFGSLFGARFLTSSGDALRSSMKMALEQSFERQVKAIKSQINP